MVKVIRPPNDNVEEETVDTSDDSGYQGPPSRQPMVARLTGGRETNNASEGAVEPDSQCNHLYIPVQAVYRPDRGDIHHRCRSHSESETTRSPRSHDVTCVRQVIPRNGQETRIRNNNQYVPNVYDNVINNPRMQPDRRQSFPENIPDNRVTFDSSNLVPIGLSHLRRRQNDTLLRPEGTSSNSGMRRGSWQAPYVSRLEESVYRRHSLQVERAAGTRDGRLPDDATSPPYSLGANHNHFAVDYIPGEVPQETARVGSDLFLMFLREEIQRLHLQPPDCLNPEQDIEPSSSDLLRTREFVQLGVQLRVVANEFAQSVHRERLRERAESVSLGSLDFSSFTDLMFGVFQEGGVTHERIVVLFFFCTDLAIRALREKLRARFHELTQWSQMYIMSKLSVWVEQQGGWSVILELSVHKVYRAAMIGVCCMGMIAFWVYIRNNYR